MFEYGLFIVHFGRALSFNKSVPRPQQLLALEFLWDANSNEQKKRTRAYFSFQKESNTFCFFPLKPDVQNANYFNGNKKIIMLKLLGDSLQF